MADPQVPISLKAARQVLGVGPFASAAQLRRAFRDAAKSAHPDRLGGEAERFRAVVDAYHRLRTAGRTARMVQPPVAPPPPEPGLLSISPLIALQGGSVTHLLADGRRLRIEVPAGLRSGDTLRAGATTLPVMVRGEGDMLVRGDDLWITASVAARTLAAGGRISVETPLGRRIVWVTRKAGERGLVRLEGQGLPARGRHRQGHLFLRLAAKPGQADSAARALLRRFTAAWAA